MSAARVLIENVQEPNGSTFWENVAESRWGKYISAIERRAILKAHSFSSHPSEALEMGCEGGRWSKLLCDAGWKMTCVDINAETLSVCQRRLPTARCILADPLASTLPCNTSSMDMILCIEVPPVLPDSSWFLDEARRVLKPGGLLVGSVNNLLSGRGIVHHTTARLRGVKDYYKFAYPAWRKKLRKHDFTLLHQEGFCWLPFGRSSNSRLIPTLTAAEQYLGLRKLPSLSPWIVFVAKLNTL